MPLSNMWPAWIRTRVVQLNTWGPSPTWPARDMKYTAPSDIWAIYLFTCPFGAMSLNLTKWPSVWIRSSFHCGSIFIVFTGRHGPVPAQVTEDSKLRSRFQCVRIFIYLASYCTKWLKFKSQIKLAMWLNIYLIIAPRRAVTAQMTGESKFRSSLQCKNKCCNIYLIMKNDWRSKSRSNLHWSPIFILFILNIFNLLSGLVKIFDAKPKNGCYTGLSTTAEGRSRTDGIIPWLQYLGGGVGSWAWHVSPHLQRCVTYTAVPMLLS